MCMLAGKIKGKAQNFMDQQIFVNNMKLPY